MDIYTRIREFYDMLETSPLPSGAIALWFALLHTNNKARWAEWFTVASQVLTNRTGLTRSSIIRARNTLKQMGLIDFKPNGNNATSYTLFHFETATEQVAIQQPDNERTDYATATDTINKTNTKTKTNTNTPPKPPKGADERFDRFWAAYPRKTAKEPARKAFVKIKPDDALLETMLAAIGTHSLTDQWRRDNGQYIPHAATWLNQRRWEDDAQAEPDECVNWAVNHAY